MKHYILVGLCAACSIANAGDAACTNKDFRGIYGFHSQAWNVINNAPLTFAGSLTADGNGKITAFKDVAAAAINFSKLVTPVLDRYQEAKSLGKEILYTVEPDCRITITSEFLGPTGAPSVLVWVGSLVYGGDEALLINASQQSPYISLLTVKRASRKRDVAPKE
jgi:hypothetical protein